MRFLIRFALCVSFLMMTASGAMALSIVSQDPHLDMYQNLTIDPMVLVFDQSLDRTSVGATSVNVTYESDPGVRVEVAYAFETTTLLDDTLVLTPTENEYRWPFAKRLELHITDQVQSAGSSPFDESYPFGEIFVANIPSDMDILQEWDPTDPFDFVDAFANANVLLGYNPVHPEQTEPWRPETIPGMGATEAWKVTAGRPDVIIAVVDDGLEHYDYDELEENYFLNRGELDAPTFRGNPCTPDAYDCNDDGRFNIRDYDEDPRFASLGEPPTIPDLFDEFEDDNDDDGNGLVDDICGWDFLRNTNKAKGVIDFPEGGHGEDRSRDAAGIAGNNNGDKPGYCPFCTILPVRISSSVMPEVNVLEAGIAYAYEMGADVAVFASESLNQSGDINRALTMYSENGLTLVGVASDEDSYHHAFPGSFDEVINVKAIFPIPPIDFLGFFPMEVFGFTETYCTMWGEHVHLAGSSGACSSEAAGNIAGFAGLIISRGRDLGIELSANEVKQIMTMTADDIKDWCLTWTGGTCQPGWDAHFGYGRPNAKTALAILGDAAKDEPARVPPEVKFRAPAWFRVIDPVATPQIEVAGYLHARGRSFQWDLQVAVGKEPLDNEFTSVATGNGTAAIDDVLAQVDISHLLPADYVTRPPKESFDFTATLRLVAGYNMPGYGTVRGEDRRTISIHRDQSADFGLLPQMPLNLDASGRSSITLYDMDGDTDGRLEMVVAASGPQSVMVLKSTDDGYEMSAGFPLNVMDYNGLDDAADATLSTPAVGDLFGDGEPYIVVTTIAGAVLAFHRQGTEHLDDNGQPAPLLEGFPVHAADPDNSSTDAFGHGRTFLGSPVLADLDRDGILEIIAASYDGRVYAWKPFDADNDGAADPVPGFPVFCKCEAGNVPPDKVCHSEMERFNPQIITTPAVGIFDPGSNNDDIALYPSILVGTSEVCEDWLFGLKGTRFYAIYHDGTNNASGSPFLPNFPAKLFGPASDILPLPPVTIGITSSPALAHQDGKTYVGVGSAIWYPQLLEIENGEITVSHLGGTPSFNALAHGSFGSLSADGRLHYVLPSSSILDVIDGWISLLKPKLLAYSLQNLSKPLFAVDQHDSNWYTNPAIVDISGDGYAEAICGTGGFTVDAVDGSGSQPPTWPKFTNQWSASGPTVGDVDGDGSLEIYQYTLEGWLYGWRTLGDACGPQGTTAEWWTDRHDERNTGTYGTDTQPPIVVTDLQVEETASGYRLSFTAPGDDWRCGTPVSYDIRYASSRESLEGPANFYDAEQLPDILVPAPVIGGQRVEIDVPAGKGSPWFAVQTLDDAGNHSLISVPVTVGGADDDDSGDDDSGDDDDDTSYGDDDDNDDAGCGC
ncbi:MAG: S8 family serine peptidase [Candidatus Lernaella stagnicola]|nr:S8 family serine peptidase [Candidatus Lernaella stagnicola]